MTDIDKLVDELRTVRHGTTDVDPWAMLAERAVEMIEAQSREVARLTVLAEGRQKLGLLAIFAADVMAAEDESIEAARDDYLAPYIARAEKAEQERDRLEEQTMNWTRAIDDSANEAVRERAKAETFKHQRDAARDERDALRAALDRRPDVATVDALRLERDAYAEKLTRLREWANGPHNEHVDDSRWNGYDEAQDDARVILLALAVDAVMYDEPEEAPDDH